MSRFKKLIKDNVPFYAVCSGAVVLFAVLVVIQTTYDHYMLVEANLEAVSVYNALYEDHTNLMAYSEELRCALKNASLDIALLQDELNRR
jgi:hypothetical protein